MMRMAVSHTRLDSFENCPWSFRGQYIEKIPQPKTAPMLVGGFFAEWSKRYIDHLVKKGEPTDHEAGRRLLEDAWKARGNHKEFRLMPEPLRFEMRELIDTFLDSHVFDPATVMGTELEVSLREDWTPTNWFAKDTFFRAKLDLAAILPSEEDKVIGITDYKTNQAAWSEEETKRSSQLKRYTVAMSSTVPDADRFLVTLDFVRLGIVRGPYEMLLEVADEEKGSIWAISDRIQKAIETDTWEATPGAGCAYCPVFNGCPERDAATQFRALQSDDEAVRAMQRLIIVERERKDLQGLLKPWTAQEGPVVTGNMQYGPQTTEKTSYDSEWMNHWARTYGLDVNRLLKSDNEAITRALKKLEKSEREAAQKDLAMNASVKPHSEWRLKKFKGGDE